MNYTQFAVKLEGVILSVSSEIRTRKWMKILMKSGAKGVCPGQVCVTECPTNGK